MKYVTLGMTNLTVSKISFGGIPIQRGDAQNTMKVVDKLVDTHINFIDTARGYTVSEEYLGMALKGRRDKFILATKSMARTIEKMSEDIEISLKNLKTDYIDLYQIHNIQPKEFKVVFDKGGAMEALLKAKAEGKIGHIGATTHSLDSLKLLVEEYGDVIETLMFPYNIVELHGEETLIHAREKGFGTLAMKPLAGGNIDDYELALRFIDSSEACDISIPGMGSPEEVEKNAAIVEGFSKLTEEELKKVGSIRKKLGNTFCRRCGYCMPCTQGINIPGSFLMANYLRNYDLPDWAKVRYDAFEKKASDCIQCGLCETRCPYELPIRDMLKDVVRDFGY